MRHAEDLVTGLKLFARAGDDFAGEVHDGCFGRGGATEDGHVHDLDVDGVEGACLDLDEDVVGVDFVFLGDSGGGELEGVWVAACEGPGADLLSCGHG